MPTTKQILAIPGIGKSSVLRNLQELFKDGKLSVQTELLEKVQPVDVAVAEEFKASDRRPSR